MKTCLSTFIAISTTVLCANDPCAPTPPAPCYSLDGPCCNYCLGPENVAGNPAVRPKTCNGDFTIDVAGFYWNAQQDGLAYAIETTSTNGVNLIDSHFLRPHSHWEPGFKLGIGYNTTYDGWDLELLWTRYRGRSNNEKTADSTGNQTIVPIWSAFQDPTAGATLTASKAESHWKPELDLVDFELGREFWASKYLTLRPFVSLRYGRLNQDIDISYKGGAWGSSQNDFVDMHNNFWGFGLRGGLDTVWNLCRGFAFFGDFALSILYGRFSVKQREITVGTAAPFFTTPVLETTNGFRSSKAIADLILGIQYSTMFCDCRYGFTVGLGWENHLFFNQNQLWRVTRIGQTASANSGQNVFNQTQGDFSTQGWTLNFRFEF